MIIKIMFLEDTEFITSTKLSKKKLRFKINKTQFLLLEIEFFNFINN